MDIFDEVINLIKSMAASFVEIANRFLELLEKEEIELPEIFEIDYSKK